MEKTILVSASAYKKKYYWNTDFEDLPGSIRDELIQEISNIAGKVNGIISLGFDEKGEIFIEEREEEVCSLDEIGAALEIKAFQRNQRELLKSLKLWYMIYRTPYGEIVREIVAYQNKNLPEAEILELIAEKHGEEGRTFAEQMLED